MDVLEVEVQWFNFRNGSALYFTVQLRIDGWPECVAMRSYKSVGIYKLLVLNKIKMGRQNIKQIICTQPKWSEILVFNCISKLAVIVFFPLKNDKLKKLSVCRLIKYPRKNLLLQ